MTSVPIRRAQALLAAEFAAAFGLQLAAFLYCFQARTIFADNLQVAIEALVKLYAAPLAMITAALFATPPVMRTARVEKISFVAAMVACSAWNLVLLVLTIGFLAGTDKIESFVPMLASIGASVNWLTGGALTFFFVKNAGAMDKPSKGET